MNGLGQDRIKRMVAHHRALGLKRGGVGLLGFNLAAKSADPKNPRDIVVTANTDTVDLDDEIVVPYGCDKTHYEKNRANFLDHKYETEFHIGTMRSFVLNDAKTAWLNRSSIFSGLRSPYADDVLKIAQQAGIGASIGFAILEAGPPTSKDPVGYQKAGFIIRKWLLVELSFTAMPCNVTCRTMHETGYDEEKIATIDEMVTKSVVRLESAVALGFPYRKSVAVTTPARRWKRAPIVVLDT